MQEKKSQANVRYRVGLVGAGHICEYHIAALKRLPEVEILGVCDIDSAKAKETADKAGVGVYESIEAFRESGANVIHVLTPPHTHAAVALKALDNGCHVLIEKPLAVDIADCRKIVEKAREKGLQACVDHSLLYDPQVERALEMVRQGKLGKIVSVDILRSSLYPPFPAGPLPPQYRTAGYPFRDLGVHALYLFEAFLGPIQNVQAEWSSLGGDPNLAFDEWRAQVRCRDGMGQFQLSWNVRPLQNQIIIQGTKAVLRLDIFLMFSSQRKSTPLPKPVERMMNVYSDSLPPLFEAPRNAFRFITGKIRQYHGVQSLIAAFYQSLTDGTPNPVPAEDAIAVVDWTEKVARAADEDYAARLSRLPALANEAGTVLVTGAGGGLGSAIVERLLAEGKRVRLFVRRIPHNIPANAEIVVGDLGDSEAIERAVSGVDMVVHAGAAMKGDWTEHERATVRGTEYLLAACKKQGVRKLVHISSLSVVEWAGANIGAPISEETPYEPKPEMRGAYTRAKLDAERLVVQAAKDGLPVVILRPGQIFGRKLPLLTPAVARKSGKKWVVLGDARLTLPLVYIDDVVDAVMLAAEGDLQSGEIIQLVDPVSLTQADVLKMTQGEKAKVVRVPRPVVFALGGLSQVLLGLLGKESPLSVYRLKSALAKRTFVSDRAKELLGWEARVGVCAGIRRVVSGSETK